MIERIDTAAVVQRLITGRTQAEIAQAIGVTQTAVSYWANGQRQPGFDDIAKILDATGRTWADVFPHDHDDIWAAGYEAGLAAARRAIDGCTVVPPMPGFGPLLTQEDHRG